MMPGISHFVLAAVLCAASAPQQPSQDPPSSAPQTSTQSGSQQPAAPSNEQTEANRRIRDSISDLLKSDPVLGGSDVAVTVDDRNLTLTGTVKSYTQHQRVLQLVSSYGRWRNIVDKIH